MSKLYIVQQTVQAWYNLMIWVSQDVEEVLQNAVCLMEQAKNIQLKINGCQQYILQYNCEMSSPVHVSM